MEEDTPDDPPYFPISSMERTNSPSMENTAISSSRLQFITVTDPRQLKNSTNRRKTSTHVMLEYQRQKRQTSKQVFRNFRDKRERPLRRASHTASSFPYISPQTEQHSPSNAGSKKYTGDSRARRCRKRLKSSEGATSAFAEHGTSEIVESPEAPVSRFVDPLNIYPIRMASYMHDLFEHFTKVLGPCTYDLPTSNGVTPPPLKTFFPLALSSDFLFHAFLCINSAHKRLVGGLSGFDRRTLFHRGIAVRRLVEEFEKPNGSTSDAAILTVMSLAFVDALLGDISSREHHQRGLRRMVEIRGGVKTLPRFGIYRNLVLWVDQHTGLLHQKPMHYDIDELGLENVDLADYYQFDEAVGQGFQDLRNSRLLDPSVATLLRDMALVRALSQTTRITESMLYDIISKRDHIACRLTSFCFGTILLESVDLCCCLAAMMYDDLVYRFATPAPPFHLAVATRLRTALIHTFTHDRHFGAWSPESLLWVLFAASTLDPDTEIRAWFVRKIWAVTCLYFSEMELLWEDVRCILLKFLWLDKHCDIGGQNLWADVQMMDSRNHKAETGILEARLVEETFVSRQMEMQFEDRPELLRR